MPANDQTAQPPSPTNWTDAQGAWHQTPGRFTLRDCTDDALARLATCIRRDEEDGSEVPERVKAAVHRERTGRFLLRMRYGAVDDHAGTHSYDRWYRLGQPPTYTLAACMDRYRWELGQQHVLDWAATDDTVTARHRPAPTT